MNEEAPRPRLDGALCCSGGRRDDSPPPVLFSGLLNDREQGVTDVAIEVGRKCLADGAIEGSETVHEARCIAAMMENGHHALEDFAADREVHEIDDGPLGCHDASGLERELDEFLLGEMRDTLHLRRLLAIDPDLHSAADLEMAVVVAEGGDELGFVRQKALGDEAHRRVAVIGRGVFGETLVKRLKPSWCRPRPDQVIEYGKCIGRRDILGHHADLRFKRTNGVSNQKNGLLSTL